MKVLWVFPDKELCGISIYSKDYCNSLSSHISIYTVDPSDYIDNRDSFFRIVNISDIVHIQYDTTFYYNNNFNYFSKLARSIHKPKIIQLHEVYHEFPLVYPRDKINGIW
ncbi:MAG: hypothetical protein GX640_22405, partial [Fibrobacter sp.]|nr:hypothetical protein [Fibrobacter sp.]